MRSEPVLNFSSGGETKEVERVARELLQEPRLDVDLVLVLGWGALFAVEGTNRLVLGMKGVGVSLSVLDFSINQRLQVSHSAGLHFQIGRPGFERGLVAAAVTRAQQFLHSGARSAVASLNSFVSARSTAS